MKIRSELKLFPGRGNRKMAGYWDRAEESPGNAPFVVLSPKFGETKKNNIPMAYALAANGLNVFRFDHLDHTGESDGRIYDYTFRGATGDILVTLDFLEAQFQAREFILLANSMSVRPAIRAAALDPRVARVISLVGVVNFQATSCAVYQEDMVALHLAGKRIGNTDILGHEVHVSRFLEGAIAENMHDLEGTIADLRQASADFFFIAGSRDPWVARSDLQEVLKVREEASVLWLDDSMHELRENPSSAREGRQQAVFACKFGRFGTPDELEKAVVPESRSQAMQQNRVERSRLRQANPLIARESDFWSSYLKKYGILEHVGDFTAYLELVCEVLAPIGNDHCILDIGCGNGLFGVGCLQFLIPQQGFPGPDRPVCVGLDLTPDGLADAATRHHAARNRHAAAAGGTPTLDFAYLPYDLEVLGRQAGSSRITLPFADHTFDRICCSLLLSYLRRPIEILLECHRILKPGGRIMVSSMKPHCDLSLLYSNLVGGSRDPAVLESARNLLSAAGAIRVKEEQGHYTFFSRKDLLHMMAAAGFNEPQAFRSFGDQANLVAASR